MAIEPGYNTGVHVSMKEKGKDAPLYPAARGSGLRRKPEPIKLQNALVRALDRM